jgi:hypothetical protein
MLLWRTLQTVVGGWGGGGGSPMPQNISPRPSAGFYLRLLLNDCVPVLWWFRWSEICSTCANVMALESENTDLFIADQYRLIFSFLNKNYTKSLYPTHKPTTFQLMVDHSLPSSQGSYWNIYINWFLDHSVCFILGFFHLVIFARLSCSCTASVCVCVCHWGDLHMIVLPCSMTTAIFKCDSRGYTYSKLFLFSKPT